MIVFKVEQELFNLIDLIQLLARFVRVFVWVRSEDLLLGLVRRGLNLHINILLVNSADLPLLSSCCWR